MTFPHSHKTIIVLDRSPYFINSSKQTIEFDVFTKTRAQGIIPLAPIEKTLWTCNVEAGIEYCRIVYDIYPKGKLIQVITSDSTATSLNTWAHQEQNITHLMTALGRHGPPPSQEEDDCSVMHGLTQAIQVLCEPSDIQHQVRTSLTEMASKAVNRGRIICLTSIKSDTHINLLEECIQDALNQHNKLAASTDNLMPIFHCELVLLHVVPVGTDSNIVSRAKKQKSACLSTEVHVSQSGRYVAVKLVQLVQEHYDLASTSITGIPMKEEQNASSSANYDVEILHPSEAHVELLKSGSAPKPEHVEGLVAPSKEVQSMDTITLKWCTPKSSVVELQQCIGTYRISPVDVNSRPSSCLTNFLLNGRAVMLEVPKKTGTKMMSHMLASHGGEIYIHALATSRMALEDPPSISEGCGGRVTDYRITDFGELQKENRLAPAGHAIEQMEELPVERAKAQLERMTRYWPLVINETIIFNMLSHLDPLPSLIVKERLDEEELLDCKKAILHVVGMENKNEALPVPTVGSRGKGPKRDEQYRQMWAELETLVRAHASTSPQHQKVLECLLDCKRPSDEKGSSSPKKLTAEKAHVKEEKIKTPDVENAWKELDRYQRLTEREKQDLMKMEPKSTEGPPVKRVKPSNTHSINKSSGPQSLLSLWTSRMSSLHSQRHAEFAGRLESSGTQAELYIHLKEENGGEQGPESAPKTNNKKS